MKKYYLLKLTSTSVYHVARCAAQLFGEVGPTSTQVAFFVITSADSASTTLIRICDVWRFWVSEIYIIIRSVVHQVYFLPLHTGRRGIKPYAVYSLTPGRITILQLVTFFSYFQRLNILCWILLLPSSTLHSVSCFYRPSCEEEDTLILGTVTASLRNRVLSRVTNHRSLEQEYVWLQPWRWR